MLRELTCGIWFSSGFNKLFVANKEMDRFKASTIASQVHVTKLNSAAQRMGSSLGNAFRSSRNAISSNLELLSKYKMELGLIAAAGGYLMISSAGAAGDAAEALNKYEVIFGNASKSGIKWIDKFSSATKRSKYDTIDWLSSFGAVFGAVTKDKNELIKLSEQMVSFAVDLGSLYNKKPQEAVQALTSALVGNHEAVRSLNIILTDEDVTQYAVRRGLVKSKKELTSTSKIMARMGLMLERGSIAFGDATNTAYSYNNQIVAMESNIKDLRVSFGEKFLPIFNKGLITLNAFLDSLKGGNFSSAAGIVAVGTAIFFVSAALGAVYSMWPFIKNIFFNPKAFLLSIAIIGLVLILQDLWVCLKGGKGILSPVINLFKKYGEIIKVVGIAIGIFFAPGIILGAFNAIVTLAKGVAFLGWALKFHWLTSIWPVITSVWAFTAALWACPITWIIVGVIALGAAIFLLVKNWDKVVAGFKIGLNWLKQAFTSFKTWITGVVTSIASALWNLLPPWMRWLITKAFGAGKAVINSFVTTKDNTFKPKGLSTNIEPDRGAASQLVRNNSRVLNQKINNNKFDIKISGSDPTETSKQVRNELDRYFGQEEAGSFYQPQF